ncbi:hypothetical protein N0V83_000815 [Neocucurbitaria cava]|uniref:Uncharacterized protein n=1 Tax=Neocucurbitaria cava TaxID=798079 RepID=A0A9W8YK53_9PLEO|nr:hypothetical protein N0V83_000815 [Neocucurbitaria cava]
MNPLRLVTEKCFDDDTGEQVQVLHQGTQPVFLDRSYIQFTTSDSRQSYELPFIASSLQPGRKYKLRFTPTTSISHWPASAEDALNSLAGGASSSSVSTSDIPAPSTQNILWEAAAGNDTVVFETRSSRPSTPNVTVSLSAPSTYSLSKPFTFSLTFSTDTACPITVLADRARVKSLYSDVKILDATTRVQLAPDVIVCRDEDEHQREEFSRLEGTYTEHRELDLNGPLWENVQLEVGKEYILSHLGGTWWWTEDSIDEVMTYLESKSSIGLALTETIQFASAGEVGFKVVE